MPLVRRREEEKKRKGWYPVMLGRYRGNRALPFPLYDS